MVKFWFLLLIPFTLISQGFAQAIRCEASVERAVVEQGSNFLLTIEISGGSLNITGGPQIPDLSGLEVISQGGESSSIMISNGRKSETRQFTYQLRAREVGRWVIPVITLFNERQPVSTKPLSIEVVPRGSISGSKGPSAEEAFLSMQLSKKEAYIGEQLTMELKIYSRTPITQYAPSRIPGFTGFWAEEFPVTTPIQPTKENIKGVSYFSYIIKRTALFPTHAGQLTVDPCEIECEIRLPRKGGFLDDFFSDPFGQTAMVRIQSESLSVSVKPLPEENKPADFTGMVGQFDMTSSVDRTNLKTGEALTYTLTIRGTGNIASAPIPEVPFGEAFETYEPKVTDAVNKKSTLISGTKTIEYIAVPRAAKDFEIPALTLTYYDPATKTYVSKTTHSEVIRITENSRNLSATGTNGAAYLIGDIRPLKTSVNSWNPPSIVLHERWWVLCLAIAPLFMLTLGRFYFQKRDLLEKDTTALRYAKASPLAKQRLKIAEHLVHENKVDRFYTELSKTLYGFIADKMHLTGLAVDHVSQTLREKGIEERLIQDYLDCMQMIDEARFSPEGTNGTNLRLAFERVRTVILDLDRVL